MAPTSPQTRKKAKKLSDMSERSTRTSTQKSRETLVVEEGLKPPGKSRQVAMNWSKPDMHAYTDALLTIIEENAKYKEAFGFETSKEDGRIKNGGQKQVIHYQTIARKLLIEDPSGQWKDGDVIKLGEAVKNRINWIKSKYKEFYAELGATGQGLIDEDKEDTIQEGTKLGNLWDKIQTQFPWFKRVHENMRKSPLVNKDACKNSASSLDLSVLGQGSTIPCDASGPASEDGLSNQELVEDISNSVGGLFDVVGFSNEDETKEISTFDMTPSANPPMKEILMPKVLVKPEEKKSSIKTSGLGGPGPTKKRMDTMDKLLQLSREERADRIRLVAKQMEAKAERKQIKQEGLDWRTQLQIQAEEDKRRSEQEHERFMMEKKLELQRMMNTQLAFPWDASPSPRPSHSSCQGDVLEPRRLKTVVTI